MWGPEVWGSERRASEGWGGPNFRAFFPLLPSFSFFFSLWGSSRGILVVFEAQVPSNVHVWALGLSCETPAAGGPEEGGPEEGGPGEGGPGEGGPGEGGPGEGGPEGAGERAVRKRAVWGWVGRTHKTQHTQHTTTQANVPPVVVEAIRVGRLTAAEARWGCARDCCRGRDQEIGSENDCADRESRREATAPHQYALSTRAGSECIAHVLQNPQATVISIDGLGAFNQISQTAMLDGLLNVGHCGAVLPFVRMFYGAPSSYLLEDSAGTVHTIRQGEGGEQGDALMPLHFAVGQHSALDAVQEELQEREVLLAFHDDIYVVTPDPARVGPIYAVFQEHLHAYARIRINGGKTQVWNRGGTRPEACDVPEQIAQSLDPDAQV